MFWKVGSFPKCLYHVFLSHSSEDRGGLVRPVYNELSERKLECFIDVEDFSYGRGTRHALGDGVLNSRHTVFFITDVMLDSPRGWCVMELVYAELMDLNFNVAGGKLLNGILPLFLVDQSDPRIPRSVWQLATDRGSFFNRTSRETPVDWCVSQICRFLAKEFRYCKTIRDGINDESEQTKHLKQTPGLFDRVTKFQPRLPKL